MGSGFGKMMKQAKKMQEDMLRAQEELAAKEVEVTAGGGVIKVVATGDGKIASIQIKPEVVDPEDVDMLQDLVLSAVNQGIEKAAEMSREEMSKITGGLDMPGLGM